MLKRCSKLSLLPFLLTSLVACGTSERADHATDASSVDGQHHADSSTSTDASLPDSPSGDATVRDGAQQDATTGASWGLACNPTPGIDEVDDHGLESYVDFTVSVSGFDEYNGKPARVRTDQQAGDQVYAATEHIMTNGGFSVTWPNAKERFTYQYFYGYVDVNSDGRCNVEADLIWQSSTNGFNDPDNDPFVHAFSETSTWVMPANATEAQATCDLLNQC